MSGEAAESGPDQRSSRAERFEELALGGSARYTSEEIAHEAGIPIDAARRFWRALGFPNAEDSAVAYTDYDLSALRRMVALVRGGAFDSEFAVRLTRSLGQTTGRLAEWQVQALYEHLTEDGSRTRDQAVRAAVAFAATNLSEFEWMLVYAWRRQLAAVADRALVPSDPDAAPKPLAVGFADLVSYTRLARQLDERELGRLVSRFETVCNDVIAGSFGRLIKSVGDEVLYVADDVELGAEIGLQLAEAMARDPLLPQVRVGVAYGNVVSRLGDVFGTTVNLASRLTAWAAPGHVVCDGRTADALAGHPAYRVIRQPTRPVPGIGDISAGLLTRADPAAG